MSTTLEPADLTGATVGTTGSIDLTQVTGPGGISYAIGGQATLRLHNESNCGLRCMFDNSGQSFNLPAGGWSDSYPKSSDNALNFSVLYTLSSPGVTLLLSTYYYPGEPVPAITTLGNSPIGGGNVSTNFSELINTANNPLSTLINVQPNDAAAPTWSADNSGNFIIKSDNAGVLTQLLQLVAGASPEVILGAASVLTQVAGQFRALKPSAIVATTDATIALSIETDNVAHKALVLFGVPGQTADLFQVLSAAFARQFWIDSGGNANLANNLALQSLTTGGAAQKLISLNATNITVISAPTGAAIAFTVGASGQLVEITPLNCYLDGVALSLGSNLSPITITNGSTIPSNMSSQTLTNTGAATGVIIQLPAQSDGQVLCLINNGSGSITFASSGTSHVASGTAISIAAGNTAMFVSSTIDGLWHRIVAN